MRGPGLIAVLMSLAACDTPGSPQGRMPVAAEPPRTEGRIQAEVGTALAAALDAARAKAGLAPLGRSPALDGSARFFVRDMVRNDYFATETPAGLTTAGRAVLGGYCPLGVREIISYSTAAEDDLVAELLDNPGNRDILLWPAAVEFGFARLDGRMVLMLGDGC